MIICFWNIRGLNNPQKQSKVLNRAKLYNIDILCLLETRVKTEKASNILHSNFGDWNKNIDISFCHSTSQSITVKCIFNNESFIITTIYGTNNGLSRRLLWQTLRDLDLSFGTFPWILGGDFNTYLDPKESSDFDLLGPFYSSDMKDFHDVIFDLQLCDHPYFGPTFTWSNKQKENYLARKLDRVLINPLWSYSFQKSFVEFTAPGPSDHCMALVWLSKETQSLNKDFYSNISVRVKLKKAELENTQLSTLKGISPIESELNVQKELITLEEAEHLFLKQKAKVNWIKEGDRCTKFFHSAIANKHKRETIRVLINEQGQKLESFDDLAYEILDFFKGQLGTVDHCVQKTDPLFLKNLLQVNLPSETATDLTKIVTSEEIKEAIFNQGNDKSPGPDGFTPFFFKKTWNINGEDVINAIKFFFKETFLLPAFNSTIIALIPKIQNPSKVKDFRPISCCSVVYKIITKILVKRMTKLLPDIISLNQTSFVRGRTIIDNTLLAQELVKGYGRKIISPRCALKVDLQKAFDCLHWDFISATLIAIGLPNIFINWIEACYKEARYSISLNGSLIGYFKGQRGVRQGDPLSPILFVLAMNILSKILNIAAARGIFGNIDSVIGILTVLQHFYCMSGLKLNVNKTELFAAGISHRSLEAMKCISGFKQGFLPVRQFMLPQSVIKRIDQLCARFLWKGSDQAAVGARISWNYICNPKSKGGLGFKNIKTWNKACMIQLIRNILVVEGSLWVAWIKLYVIKNKDFNELSESPTNSWGINKLIKLRNEALPILNAGVSKTKKIWDEIREKHNKVPWHNVVWFPLHIPKASVITCMAILDRLPTRARLSRMGISTDGLFVLCKEEIETRNHFSLICTNPTRHGRKDLNGLVENGKKSLYNSWTSTSKLQESVTVGEAKFEADFQPQVAKGKSSHLVHKSALIVLGLRNTITTPKKAASSSYATKVRNQLSNLNPAKHSAIELSPSSVPIVLSRKSLVDKLPINNNNTSLATAPTVWGSPRLLLFHLLWKRLN
ncbi:uncharacterized protein LOC120218420 [Hibiscus syriacus]|uniref:uncharacterized protein LOC120218420 n=1 Tax=Hibiscus syriacus TaxID=106335 RepID=UPI001920E364|nr:uncharacterized protein LOC120218420 [Hibiscus syriacus]